MNIQRNCDISALPVGGLASVRARFGMMALGYGAKADMVNPDAIDRVGALVFQTFGAGHELTREMDHFIDTVMSAAGRPEVWSEAGDRLLRAVERTTGREQRSGRISMAERQRLSPHDHALIHALALLSRPELRDRSKIGMIVGMIQDVLPRVSRQVERLRPLIVLAEQFASQKQGPLGDFGGLHDRARSIMNDWDGRRLADAWDVVTGKAE